MDTYDTLNEALAELSTAEEFLEYFGVEYEASIVHVNRLHILQRFRDYLTKQAAEMPDDDVGRFRIYRQWLERAYQDFVESDALTEKVFRVFHTAQREDGGTTQFVSLDRVFQS